MKPRAMYYGIGGLEMAVYRLLDVVLAKAPSEWMKSPPGGPLYGAIYSRWRAHEEQRGDGWWDNGCQMGKVRPMEARKTEG